MVDLVTLAYGVVSDLGNRDRVPHFIHRISWLGIEMEVLENGKDSAATVTRVEPDSRGADAGFQAGDVVMAVGNRGINDPREVGQHFRDVEPGDQVEMSLRRGDERVTVEVERARTGYLGIWPGPVSEDDRAALGLKDDEGLRARQVVSGGPSAKAGIVSGDILVAIAGRPVGLGNLRSRLAQIGAGETVDAAIIRDGERLTLALTLGERPDPN
jgi:S1-C subfamily serine protease